MIAFIYLVVRFGFTEKLDSFGPYASYTFEIILVSIAIFLNRERIKSLLGFNKIIGFISLAALVAGFLIFKSLGALYIDLPFELNSEVIFFLLIVAPILEEGIFRFLVWLPTEKLNKIFALVVTSFLFSYSHLHVIWSVPEQLHNFICFQTGYTLILGLMCGYSMFRYNSLLGAIATHFMFNLGFYLGSLMQ